MRLVFYLLASLLLAGAAAQAATPPAAPLPAAGAAEFVENRGQWPSPVRFAADLQAGRLFAESTGLTYVLAAASEAAAGSLHAHGLVPGRAWAYQVQFAGAGAGAVVSGQRPSGVPHSYFQGRDPSRWVGGTPGFGGVAYAGLYPGIDLAVYGNARQELEYTFTVQPGGQPAAIGLRYAGLSSLRLDSAGRLHLRTPVGEVLETAPVAWQVDPVSGQRQSVSCAFRLQGSEVGFTVGAYDPGRLLVIDPVVQFATFSGARADNWGHTSGYDAQGNFYSASTVFDFAFPTSPGAYDTSFNGTVDVAVVKYNPQASGSAARVWATLLGGQRTDAPHRLAITATGEVVVLGSTSSANFPTTDGAAGRTFQGGPSFSPDAIAFTQGADLFVARLAAGGNQLLASTLLGGSGTDGFALYTDYTGTQSVLGPAPDTGYGCAGGLQIDAAGEVYVATTTASRNFAAGASGNATFGGGTTDAVVLRLAADLRSIRWRQLVGGGGDDAAYDLALSADGTAVYVCGGTQSADFPVTPGAYAPAGTGLSDGFVAQLATGTGQRLAACRVGTARPDQALLLALDPAGQVVVAGVSAGTVPISPQHYGLPGRCFLLQLDAGLRTLAFSTTLGVYDNYFDQVPVALSVGDCGQLYLAWVGRTVQAPVSPGTPPVPPRHSFYALRLSAGARTLEYAQRLPGDHAHSRSSFDRLGRLYLAVCGDCDRDGSFAVPAGVITYAGQNGSSRCNDASLLADFSPAAASTGLNAGTLLCAGADPVPLGGSPLGGTWSGPGVSGSSATGYVFTPTAALQGAQQLTYQPPAGTPVACAGPSTLQLTVALPTPVTFAPLGGPFCPTSGTSLNVALQASPAGGYFSGPGVTTNNGTYANLDVAALAPGTYTITYTLPGNTSQCGSASQTFVVRGTALTLSPDTALCSSSVQPFQLRARPAGGTWSGPGVTASGRFSPALAFTAASSSGFVRLAYTFTGADGCPTVRSTGMYKAPPLPADQLLPPPVCRLAPALAGYAPYPLRLPQPPPPAAGSYPTYRWSYGDGSGQVFYYTNSFFGLDTVHVYTQPGTYAPVLTISYGPINNPCTHRISVAPFTIGEAPLLPNIITPNGDGLNDTFVQNWFCEPPRLRVFSRWGRQVYQHDAYRSDWGGAELAAGLYYYLLTDPAHQRPAVKGWLEIVR